MKQFFKLFLFLTFSISASLSWNVNELVGYTGVTLNYSNVEDSFFGFPPLEKHGPTNYAQGNKTKKMCRYREYLFPVQSSGWGWNWIAGAGCYQYYPPDWFSDRINIGNMIMSDEGVNYSVPFGMTSDGTPIGFDHKHERYSEIIRNSFAEEKLFKKWENCAINAEICCTDVMDDKNIHGDEEYPCPATWDAWTCYHPAIKGDLIEMPCPEYTSSASDTPCILYSQKECFVNGTWNQQTEYGTCATAPVYRRRHNFHVIVLYVSIALSFPAVIIFLSYRNLRILRVNLHRNLLIACIIRNIFTIMSKELVILDSLKASGESNNVLDTNGVACKVLAYFNSVAANAIYACMLMDGFYLHKLIVRIFSSDPNVYIMYAVTAVLSFLPTTIWAVLLAIEADEYCWMVDSSWYQWIPDGFRIAILSINIILLCDIIRALLSKLRQNVSAQHTKYTYILITNGMSYSALLRRAYISTLKAMFFLIPLFGVPFILTANRNIVNSDSCTAGDIYYYVSYSIQALQSVMVAILFCYWNKEVHTQIKGTYRKANVQYQARFNSKNDRRQTTYRRETAATYVHNNSVAPKLNNQEGNFNLPPEDSNNKVKNWLHGNKGNENLDCLPLEPIKDKDLGKDSVDTGIVNKNMMPENSGQQGIFDSINKFIDDSNESLGRLSENTPSNQQGLRQPNGVYGTDDLSQSCPTLTVLKNNLNT